MLGIRLDSGDLTWLSIQARQLLDDAGFANASIVASNDLDEHLIENLKQQGAQINVWGVGTRLATAFEQPALGGVYKLSAVREHNGTWEPRVKLSEQAIKVSNPGTLQVRRYSCDGEFLADAIYDVDLAFSENSRIIDPMDVTRQRPIDPTHDFEDLLLPMFRGGKRVYDPPSIHLSRERTKEQLSCFYKGIRRFVNPHEYPVGLESELHELKTKLILAARGHALA